MCAHDMDVPWLPDSIGAVASAAAVCATRLVLASSSSSLSITLSMLSPQPAIHTASIVDA